MNSVQLIVDLVQSFNVAFSQPSFSNFCYLLLTWILTPGRRSITALLNWGSLDPLLPKPEKHFSVFHRFFSRARWAPDRLGEVLLKHLLPFLDGNVHLLLDDTLCRRSGPRILGAGMHYDPLRSTYMGKTGRRIALAFGVNFVVLAVWVPFRYCHGGGLAVPLLFRLYRPKSLTQNKAYKKRTELAVELICRVVAWLERRKVVVIADYEYACRTVLQALPANVHFIGPIPGSAQLHAPEVPAAQGRGRRRIWGKRIPAPAAWRERRCLPWRKLKLQLYGRPVTLKVKEFLAVWRSAGAQRVLKVILVRDPRGIYKDSYFFTTDITENVSDVLRLFSRRWAIEVVFRNSKQWLGLETTHNGWTRRSSSREKVAGPQADPHREPIATSRTAPFAWIAYGLVVVWYLQAGDPEGDIARVRQKSPWYRHKAHVSFKDMLTSFRRSCCQEIFVQPSNDQGCPKNNSPQAWEVYCAA